MSTLVHSRLLASRRLASCAQSIELFLELDFQASLHWLVIGPLAHRIRERGLVQGDAAITNWQTARIEGPVQNKALTRFNINWVWDGKPAILQSRAMDETGFVQPTYGQLRKVRGTKSIYHNNAIQSWKVIESGEVSNVQVL